MKHKKIKVTRRKRKMRMTEIYKAKCEQVDSLHRKLRVQETTIRLLRKVIDDAQEQRNEMALQISELERENLNLRNVLSAYGVDFEKSAKRKKALSELWERKR